MKSSNTDTFLRLSRIALHIEWSKIVAMVSFNNLHGILNPLDLTNQK